MRQILKKVSALCAVAACSAAMISSASVVYAAEGADEQIITYIESSVATLTEELIGLSDEDMASLKENGNEFAISAVAAWESSKAEVGELVEIGETEVVYDDKMYSATVKTDFETYDAEFVYVFDETGAPTSVSVDVKYPLSVNMKRAAMNTLMGIGTVFIVLVFLMFVISLFKFIPSGKKKSSAAPAPAPAPAAVPVVEEETDDTELIAVIAAAIAASEGAASADGFVVRSIRKVNRKVR